MVQAVGASEEEEVGFWLRLVEAYVACWVWVLGVGRQGVEEVWIQGDLEEVVVEYGEVEVGDCWMAWDRLLLSLYQPCERRNENSLFNNRS